MLVSSVLQDPFALDEQTNFTIGRGDENVISLPTNQVSRVHALIKWDGEGFAVIDKKSTNGTHVNDEAISRRRLKHGDRIGIGPFELRFFEAGGDPSALAPLADSSTGVITIPGAFSGDLTQVATSEVCQLIELHRKSGILTFDEGERRGRIYFANGRAIHAEFREFLGEVAALELLTLREGRFRFFARDVSVMPTIERPVQALLLEAARKMDEGAPPPPASP